MDWFAKNCLVKHEEIVYCRFLSTKKSFLCGKAASNSLFLISDISQGSVETKVRCGGKCDPQFLCKFRAESGSEIIMKIEVMPTMFSFDSHCTPSS